ncbi:MAG: response regulator [Thermodesulfobacteriota bacterium]
MEKQTAKILIVDDEPEVCRLLQRWLSSEGYGCRSASSGEMALDCLATEEFHLLISDIMMPGMSGIDLLGVVTSQHPGVAVILVTAVDDRDTAIMTLKMGAFAYIVKPLERNKILYHVTSALERRRLTLINRECAQTLEGKSQLSEKLEKLIHSLPIGVAEFALARPIPCDDPVETILSSLMDAGITHGNSEFARINRLPGLDQLKGLRFREVFPCGEQHRQVYRGWIQNRFSTRSFESIEGAKEGAARYFENMLVGNVENDAIADFWALKRDITHRRQLRQALFEEQREPSEHHELELTTAGFEEQPDGKHLAPNPLTINVRASLDEAIQGGEADSARLRRLVTGLVAGAIESCPMGGAIKVQTDHPNTADEAGERKTTGEGALVLWRLRAADMAGDVRCGKSDADLMATYGLSPRELQRIFGELVDMGALRIEELYERSMSAGGALPFWPAELPKHYLTVALPIFEAGLPEVKGLFREITEKGLGITGLPTRVGDVKNLEIPTKGLIVDKDRISFTAQCRWVKSVGPERMISAGFQITDIDEESLDALRKLIRSFCLGD